jgi:hypothetical protein
MAGERLHRDHGGGAGRDEQGQGRHVSVGRQSLAVGVDGEPVNADNYSSCDLAQSFTKAFIISSAALIC